MNLEADTWAIARRVCTPAELRALRKREDAARSAAKRDEEWTWEDVARRIGCLPNEAAILVSRAEARIRREVASR